MNKLLTMNEYTQLTTLEQWLAFCEQLHAQNIELGLERVQKVRQALGLDFECPVFVVAGTNGKGSTCAMLESILMEAGYRVGVYNSPHLIHFEERCRINGQMIQGESLIPHFVQVEQARRAAGDISLTYFEFTTLAILHYLSEQELDAAVLEIGLGGRLDAVNIIDNDCAIITSIDIDHTEFLGPDRESIGFEKAGIMRAHKPVIVSDPMPPDSVLAHARETQADLWRFGQDFNYVGNAQQWSWSGRGRRYNGLAYPALRGANQLLNASGVLAALTALRESLPVSAQDVRMGLAQVTLPGRFEIVPGQPVVVLDVAHNPHAVAVLAENLDQMGFYPQTHAVFGAMHDKDLRGVMLRMQPLVDHWYFTDLPTARAVSATALEALWHALPPLKGKDVSVQCCADPHSALLQALEKADPADRIVVFGSFYTVGGVLEHGIPRNPVQR